MAALNMLPEPVKLRSSKVCRLRQGRKAERTDLVVEFLTSGGWQANRQTRQPSIVAQGRTTRYRQARECCQHVER